MFLKFDNEETTHEGASTCICTCVNDVMWLVHLHVNRMMELINLVWFNMSGNW